MTTGHLLCFFPNLRVWGLTPCSRHPAFGARNRLQRSATVCNRPQPFATMRNRPSAAVVGAKLPCLWEKSQKRDFFDVSEDVVMSFCVAGVALRGIPSCFKARQKSFCVAGAILLLHFQKMCCIFCGRRSTLDISDFMLHGRRSTLDVSRCVFLRIALSALCEVVTRCKFRGRRGIL